jgi:hypothetical protein
MEVADATGTAASRTAAPRDPGRKPLAKILGEAVSMNHYQRSLSALIGMSIQGPEN